MKPLEQFRAYLSKRGFHPQTIYGYGNKLKQYLDWCEDNGIHSDTASLEDLYTYKNHCNEQGLALNTVRERLSIIKHYFQSIQREGNPA